MTPLTTKVPTIPTPTSQGSTTVLTPSAAVRFADGMRRLTGEADIDPETLLDVTAFQRLWNSVDTSIVLIGLLGLVALMPNNRWVRLLVAVSFTLIVSLFLDDLRKLGKERLAARAALRYQQRQTAA